MPITGNGKNNLLVGTSGNDEIFGLGGEDVLIGSGGNDTLDGGTGEDTMDGGSGNDTYVVDNSDDQVVEYANKGEDKIKSSITYSLNFAEHVENLTLTGSADIDGYGDELDNDIFGNSGDNDLWGLDGNDVLKGGGGDDTLLGGFGDDIMIGGTGDDYYAVDDLNDSVTENAGQGIDTVASSHTFYTLAANVEKLILTGSGNINGTGNDQNNEIIGNSGNNFINGSGGADVMKGGDGNDLYLVDGYFDQVTELTGQGTDTVASHVHYGLGANLENLSLEGWADINGQGNGLDNSLHGNIGNNELHGNGGDDILNGNVGVDTMYGGEDDDEYVVEGGDDFVIELADEGTDTVSTWGNMDYTLPDNVENLTLYVLGYDSDATGNALNNIIKGSNNNNVLDGSLGQDTMVGFTGNDTYYVDNDGDVTLEQANQGNDFVYSTVNLTLADNIETLSLQTGSAVFATGNAAHNTLFGNGNDNVLDGGGANDILSGLGGNDTFVFQAGQAQGDVVYEFEGNGAGLGDVLKFTGYGPGATFTQQTATEWFISSADGSILEVITLVGAPTMGAGDYVFV